MTVLNRDMEIIKHMSDYCNQIFAAVERFGDDYSTFTNLSKPVPLPSAPVGAFRMGREACGVGSKQNARSGAPTGALFFCDFLREE